MPGAVPPDVGHGQGDELGEGAGAVDADALGVGAEVAAAGEAVAAAAADHVAFAADDVAGMKVVDVGADWRRSRRRIRGRWPWARGWWLCAHSSHS